MTAPEHISTIIEMVIMRKEDWQLKYGFTDSDMAHIENVKIIYNGNITAVHNTNPVREYWRNKNGHHISYGDK